MRFAAVRRPTDIVDSIEGEWLGDFERGGGHAGDGGCEEYPVGIQARAGAFEASTNVKVSSRAPRTSRWAPGRHAQHHHYRGHQDTDRLRGRQRGTAPVRNLNFVTKKPSDKWTVEFKPDKIDALGPGEVRQIKMELFAPDRTIAGDYMLTLTSNSPEANNRSISASRFRHRRSGAGSASASSAWSCSAWPWCFSA